MNSNKKLIIRLVLGVGIGIVLIFILSGALILLKMFSFPRAQAHPQCTVDDTLVVNQDFHTMQNTRLHGWLQVDGDLTCTKCVDSNDIKQGARITLDINNDIFRCDDITYWGHHFITVPAGKILKVWAMGKTRSPTTASVLNTATGQEITTNDDYTEGNPLITGNAGETIAFGTRCSAINASVIRRAYWVFSIE